MATFPQTAELFHFPDLPPEDPISVGGTWTATRYLRPPMMLAGQITDSAHGDPNYSSYVAEVLCTNTGTIEVWACSAGGQLGAALETWRIALFSNLGFVNGYQLYYGGGIGKGFVMWRYDNDNQFTIATAGGGYPTGMGLRITGDTVEAWATGGDPHNPADWALIASAVDTTYRGCFYMTLGVEDPTGGGLGFSCMGGGVVHRTQFYRWLPSLKAGELV